MRGLGWGVTLRYSVGWHANAEGTPTRRRNGTCVSAICRDRKTGSCTGGEGESASQLTSRRYVECRSSILDFLRDLLAQKVTWTQCLRIRCSSSAVVSSPSMPCRSQHSSRSVSAWILPGSASTSRRSVLSSMRRSHKCNHVLDLSASAPAALPKRSGALLLQGPLTAFRYGFGVSLAIGSSSALCKFNIRQRVP